MSKELFVSSTPHQTKVALVENDSLSEVYFERENEYTLAGSIYKGRVTRVLPGMQSAFVDIGLERDAFLYVSDFLELEDEEEQFEPIPAPVAKPFEVKPQPKPEAVQFRSEPEDVADSSQGPTVLEGGASDFGDEESAGNDGASSGEQQPASDERENGGEGGRRWRGRSRRRRGRRGFPDAKFARPEGGASAESPAQEEPEAESASSYTPIILPGESLAKFNRNRQPEAAPQQHESSVEAEAPAPPKRERQQREERPYQPIMLPGESISKYRREREQSRTESVTEQPSETQQEEQSHSFAAHESPAAEPEQSSWSSDREERWAPAHETFESEAAVESAESRMEEREAEEHVTSAAGAIEPEVARTPPEESYRPATSQSFEGGYEEHEEPSDRESEEHHSEVEAASSAPAHEAETAEEHPVPRYDNAPAGAFEEEVIDGEDDEDLPHPAELLQEPDEYEEMEEEIFEPSPLAAAGEQFVAAIEEDEQQREIEAYESENGETEEYAREAEASSDFDGEAADEAEVTRAQLRGPSGTAAFQQRTQRRQDFERHRGRRGGRRLRARREQPRQPVMISDLLKEGQEVLVQIAKEPIGKKGARITSHIALPGRFLVYMPTVNHIGVSRKIASEEERQRLKRIVASERENGHGGFIVRTAAAHVDEQELRADIRFLKTLWTDIKNRSENAKPPALIYHDLSLVERIMRDLVTEDFSAIWVDTEQEYERVLRFVNRFQPSLVRRVKLYTKETPLFEQFGIEEEINKGLRSKVWLKSGGYIVINQTEALVAIDINTGKYVGKTTRLEDTIFKTNVDAIKEIVRQIRLRDLGGIIVIDFIDMDERRNRQKVMQALEEELQHDRAPSKVLQFNDFGLVAITRKRVKQSLERTLGAPCPYCSANGFVKSPQTVCNEIYTEMRKMARHFEGDITLRVNPEVAKALKGQNGRWLQEMEELTGHTIIVKSDPAQHQEQFDM